MLVVIDTHVHIYPSFDLKSFLHTAFDALSLLGQQNFVGQTEQGSKPVVRKVLALTERRDCHFFRELAEEKIKLPDEFSLLTFGSDENALGIRNGAGELLYLIAGRQIVTVERIEVLALTADLEIADGLPLMDVVSKVCQEAVCVLSWSPGKWFFRRGALIRSLINGMESPRVILGDTTLRPKLYPEPWIMRLARGKGLRVVAGSDPLPFPGEEKWVGSYVTVINDAAFDDRRPAQSLRQTLRAAQSEYLLYGKRNSALDVALRLWRNQRVRLM